MPADAERWIVALGRWNAIPPCFCQASWFKASTLSSGRAVVLLARSFDVAEQLGWWPVRARLPRPAQRGHQEQVVAIVSRGTRRRATAAQQEIAADNRLPRFAREALAAGFQPLDGHNHAALADARP